MIHQFKSEDLVVFELFVWDFFAKIPNPGIFREKLVGRSTACTICWYFNNELMPIKKLENTNREKYVPHFERRYRLGFLHEFPKIELSLFRHLHVHTNLH